MKKIICLTILIWITLNSNPTLHAQIIRTYAMDQPDFIILDQNISKKEILDTSYLNLIYKLDFKGDEAGTRLYDEMCLQTGALYTKFYSRNMHINDSICTEQSKVQLQVPVADPAWQKYEIYCNIQEKKITVTQRVPFTQAVYQYEEPAPEIHWTLKAGMDTIMGYPCSEATTELFGRKYTAWYSLEIPAPYGPWKFSGLPGLILQIADERGDYIFTCIGINQHSVPIVRYDWKYRNVSKKEWMSFEKKMYEYAGQFVKNSGQNVIIMDNSEQGYHLLPEGWEAYYNPIELSK